MEVLYDNKMNMTFGEYADSVSFSGDTLNTVQAQNIFKWIIKHPRYSQILNFNIDHLKIISQDEVEIQAWCGCCTEMCLEISWVFTLTNPKTGNVGEFLVATRQCDEYTFDNSVSCKLIHIDEVKIETKPLPDCEWSKLKARKEFSWNWEAISSRVNIA